MIETKNCQNCKKDFVIDQDDQNYYDKIKVPAPTWCAKCRLIRRIANVNGWSLFYRNCDKCGKRTLSMYPPSQKITVYCQPCWWADDFDGTEHGMEYDPKRPFLEQVKELAEKTPYMPLDTSYLTLKDCDYCNGIAYSKNCILATWADYCENVFFSSFLFQVKDTIDCLRLKDSELCYEAIGQNKAYRVFFSQECDSCTDVWFSRNCYSCTNCIGCVNLRGASYCIFNEKYSKDDYEKKVAELKLNTYSGLQTLEKKAREFWLEYPYRSYTGNTFNFNVTGEYVYESKNSKNMYMCTSAEDCRYCQFISVPTAKDCVDFSGWGNNVQRMYEVAASGDGLNDVKFSYSCFPDNLATEYSFWCVATKNAFGCVNLKRKSYAILNKVYDKETYEKLKEEIKKDMTQNQYVDSTGKKYPYGEFFSPTFSNFAYNASNAGKFFPKSKEDALNEGYFWYNESPQQITATISISDLPETISETQDSIINEIISCPHCQKKYKIADYELKLHKKMDVPLPHECPKCRDDRRFRELQPFDLYDRTCAKCNTAIKTSFSPDRPEIIYCEKCYQEELV